MGHYILKFKKDSISQWGVKEGTTVKPFIEQPISLRNLIENQSHFLAKNNIDRQAIQISTLEILPPVSSKIRVVCQGLNYASHRIESSLGEKSTGNVLFGKDESSITGANDSIIRPKDCECLDYEVELGLIIKKDIEKPTKITEENLHEYIAGLILANDMSPRDLQYKDDYAQWYKAKSCRTMLPLGPVLYLLEKEDFKYLYDLNIKLWVNEQLRQSASTNQMIFKPSVTLSEISTFMNLNIGDLLLTGTPGGVVIKAPSKFIQGIATWLLSNEKKVAALRKKKNEYLKDGDIIKTHIQSSDGVIDLGYQLNTIVPFKF